MTVQRGYTLIELMVAMASASVLMVGLSSALYIAAQGMDLEEGGAARRARADAGFGRLLADARTAMRVRSLSTTGIEFEVPDRTGDSAADTLRYEWNGVSGGALTRRINGGSPVTLLTDVRSLAFGSVNLAIAAPDPTATPLVTRPVLQPGLAPTTSTSSNSISFPRPTDLVPGDLMMAVVGIENTSPGSVNAPGGWSRVLLQENAGKATLGVWTRTFVAGDSTSYNWSWGSSKDSIGWILVISNHHPTNPIAAAQYSTGKSSSPTTPNATASMANSMVLRVGAFDKDSMNTGDATGLPGHTDIWARATSNKIAAACGYAAPVGAGSVGTAAFSNSSSAEYVVATIVVSPRTPVAP